MSHWPHTGPGNAANTPPLPPRNDGHGLVPTPDAVPRPALPPRPAPGIQRKNVPTAGIQSPSSHPQNGLPHTTGHSMIPQYRQYPHGNPENSGNQTLDISHLFPGGRIPPPPPLPAHSAAGNSSQIPSNSSNTSAGVAPNLSEPMNPSPSGAYTQPNQVQSAIQQAAPTQSTPKSRDSWQPGDKTRDATANTNTYHVGHNLSRQPNIPNEPTQPVVNHDMAAINESFQTMRLANSSEAMPSYTPRPVSNPVPPIPEKVSSPTHQSPDPQLPTTKAKTTSPPQQPLVTQPPTSNASPDTPATPLTQSQGAARECISTTITFAATWYTHHRAPEFPICENCYENHIRRSRFASEFKRSYHEDGKPRACRWKSPRIKDCLWEPSLSSGSLARVVEYMIRRPTIPDCVGQRGVNGTAGIKWYRPRHNTIPAMVVCQACYEDLILSCPEFGVEHFEPSTMHHAADQTWFCDIAVPYIQREFKARAQTNDWQTFVQAVAARMSIKPCPGNKTVYPSDNFYTPVRGPGGLLICKMCFCDYILLTNLSNDWKDAGGDLARRFGVSVGCYFGRQFNMRVLAGRTLDSNDRDLFWRCMDIVNCSPRCQSQMQSPAWYTLLSNPPGFEICRGCMAAIVVPMGIEHHFMAKEGISPESKITCSFNPGIARFGTYMTKLLELVYKQDPAPLEAFVREYACLPMCARDRYVEKRHWYGWKQCTICAECYHEFIRGTALADTMPHQGTYVEGGVMCEMYSNRMRQLYLTACASNPVDPTALLEYSLQRRAVYTETMPRVRQIMSNMKIKVLQQSMALNNSLFYNATGNTFYQTLPLETTYASSAIGAGHYNHMHIKGAEYAAQAAAIGAEISGSPTYIADELERRWRAVE